MPDLWLTHTEIIHNVPKTSKSRGECFLYWLQCFIPWAVAVSTLREGFTRFEFKDSGRAVLVLCWAACMQ